MAGTKFASVRGADGNSRETSTPDNITRLSISGSREFIGEGLSVLDEDHFDMNGVENVLEGPRGKCATNVSAPNDGDGSSRCQTSWCGGFRGELANLQKRAAESSMIVCPGLTKTRFCMDLPGNGGTPNWRWWQAWCLCSSEVSAYGRKEKGAPRSVAPVSRWHVRVLRFAPCLKHQFWCVQRDAVEPRAIWS